MQDELLAKEILHALDLLDQSLAQLPESRAKGECVDLLMQLRFKARDAMPDGKPAM